MLALDGVAQHREDMVSLAQALGGFGRDISNGGIEERKDLIGALDNVGIGRRPLTLAFSPKGGEGTGPSTTGGREEDPSPPRGPLPCEAGGP